MSRKSQPRRLADLHVSEIFPPSLAYIELEVSVNFLTDSTLYIGPTLILEKYYGLKITSSLETLSDNHDVNELILIVQ